MKNIPGKLSLLTLALFGTWQVAEAAPARNVVLVHGAFADETSWNKVARLLTRKGYRVTAVANPLTSLADDVAATRKVLASQKGATVLVGHSWGGVVIGEAGNDAKVKSLVYIAAFAPDRGESVQDLSHGIPPSEGQKAIRPDARGFLTIDPAEFGRVFAAGAPDVEARLLATRQIPINSTAFQTKTVIAAWHDKPAYYGISTGDLMLPPAAESFFAYRMKANIVEIASGHLSPVTHPAEVVALIERAARD